MNWTLPGNIELDFGASERTWEALRASAEGDLGKLKLLVGCDASLATQEFAYYTPLHFAVREGKTEAVRFLLENGADATYKSGLGWQESPVGLARDKGDTELVELMENHLTAKFSISPRGQEICDAVRDGATAKVQSLLQADPALIGAADERGNTPLHWAVMTRRLDMIRLLAGKGADTDAARADGARPVHLAIHGDYWHRRKICMVRDDSAVMGFLLGQGAAIDAGVAAYLGDLETLTRIVESDASAASAANSFGYRPLSYAARRGYTDIVEFLLAAGADPNAAEEGAPTGLAFYEAVAQNHTDCAKVLLDAGANPNQTVHAGGNALYRALSNQNRELVDILYQRGITGEMHYYLSEDRFDVIGEVLKANSNVANGGGDYGFLCMTTGFASLEMVRLVLSFKPELNLPWFANNYFGYALNRQTPEGMQILKMLLEAGANPNLANWVGVTYLHKVAISGTVEVARLLLDYGADLEATDDDYRSTPLGWAARWGKQEMVEFLLSCSAKVCPEGVPGWATPSAWARKKGFPEIEALLQV